MQHKIHQVFASINRLVMSSELYLVSDILKYTRMREVATSKTELKPFAKFILSSVSRQTGAELCKH